MKYIVFYDNEINASEERYVVPPCQNKAGYIIKVLDELGKKFDVVSPSLTLKKKGYLKATNYPLSENVNVCLPATLGVKGLMGKVIRRIWQWYATNKFVYSKVKNGEEVIAYHSVALTGVLQKLKRRKNIKLILHVEEIYSDVSHNEKHRKKENSVFEIADAFIFPTAMLNEKVNKYGKPYAISHGTYKSEETIAEKFDDGKIHCVYAGTFSSEKGGLKTSLNVARYLDNKYCVHILGFGSDKTITTLNESILEIKSDGGCDVIYEGGKSGRDFISFLQKCHIGLSTQDPYKQFNDSSFPSKILTYMANGLSVVTVKIPVLESSDINELVTYYEGNDPQKLAVAIEQCVLNGFTDSRKVLDLLHEKFKNDVSVILNV